MKHTLATIGLGPVLLLQGAWVRRVTPRLPEAAGPRQGAVGHGRPLRVLVTGDSAAAGVGAAHQDQALAGSLARALAPDFAVEWLLEARTGRTTADALAQLARLPAQPFDVALVSLGVNDVTGGVGLSRWLAQQRALVDLLRGKFGARHVLLSALPPLHRFPALPQPLRWYLGARAERFNASLLQQAPALDCHVLVPEFPLVPDALAADGFHPGPGAYAAWAAAAARAIRGLRGR